MAGMAEMTKMSAARPARKKPAPTRRPAKFQVAADASAAGTAAEHLKRPLIVCELSCFGKLRGCRCLEGLRTRMSDGRHCKGALRYMQPHLQITDLVSQQDMYSLKLIA